MKTYSQMEVVSREATFHFFFFECKISLIEQLSQCYSEHLVMATCDP